MPGKIGRTRGTSVLIQPPPANSYLPWGRNVDGNHVGVTDNYQVKVLNSRISIPQMTSDGGHPFYFGGSQIPHALSSSRLFAQ
jgi:hypothetical protein